MNEKEIPVLVLIKVRAQTLEYGNSYSKLNRILTICVL